MPNYFEGKSKEEIIQEIKDICQYYSGRNVMFMSHPYLSYQYKAQRVRPKEVDIYSLKAGQRKLFICELYFMNIFINQLSSLNIKYVIYAGSSPGIHIKLLMVLFPNIIMLTADPRPLGWDTSECKDRIKHYLGYFTEETFKQMKSDWKFESRQVIFMIDIRFVKGTPSSKNETSAYEKDQYVLKDMEMQREWIKFIEPVAAMFKFRLPFVEGIPEYGGNTDYISYYDGVIFPQPYIGLMSTETRLIMFDHRYVNYVSDNFVVVNNPSTEKYKMRLYDFALYEKLCYFYNTIVRPQVEDRVSHPELYDVIPSDPNIFTDYIFPISDVELEKINEFCIAEFQFKFSKCMDVFWEYKIWERYFSVPKNKELFEKLLETKIKPFIKNEFFNQLSNIIIKAMIMEFYAIKKNLFGNIIWRGGDEDWAEY